MRWASMTAQNRSEKKEELSEELRIIKERLEAIAREHAQMQVSFERELMRD